MARSAKMTIVEAEEIVPIGTLDPNNVHLPGILYVWRERVNGVVWGRCADSLSCSVNRVVQSTAEKRIEILTLKEEAGDAGASLGKDDARKRRERIVKRAAKELKEGVSFAVVVVALASLALAIWLLMPCLADVR